MKEKRLPFLIGFILVLISIFGATYLLESNLSFLSRAKPSLKPQSVRITNVGAHQFTVSWETQEQTSGFIKYGPTSSLGWVALDDRDQENEMTSNYFLHHVTVTSLDPSQDYFLKIGSGQDLFDQEGHPYQVKTAPALSRVPLADAAYGRVLKRDGTPASDVIIYLKIANGQPLSSLTDSAGNWLIAKNLARSADLLSWVQYGPKDVEEIFVQGGPQGSSATVIPATADSPASEITLGGDYLPNESQSESNTSKLAAQTKILASQDYVLPAFTASPSGEISPTATPTATLTPSPTATPTAIPTPVTVPDSGNWFPSVLTIVIGFTLIFGSVILSLI